MVRALGTSTIILCTISMLSNPAIDECGIFRIIPVERLVVDEASQIDTFEFMVSRASQLHPNIDAHARQSLYLSTYFTNFVS